MLFSSSSVFAATTVEHVPFSVDRAVTGNFGYWDDSAGSLRHLSDWGEGSVEDGPSIESLSNSFPALQDTCGASADSGDFNGDGLDDVVMGCELNDDVGTDLGSVLIYMRNSANTGWDAGLELDNTFPGPWGGWAFCGVSVAVGDVNDDDRDDVIMGCYGNADGGGRAGSMVVFTRNIANNGFDAGVQLINNFAAVDDFCGKSVASGDINADGLDDVVAPCAQPFDALHGSHGFGVVHDST